MKSRQECLQRSMAWLMGTSSAKYSTGKKLMAAMRRRCSEDSDLGSDLLEEAMDQLDTREVREVREVLDALARLCREDVASLAAGRSASPSSSSSSILHAKGALSADLRRLPIHVLPRRRPGSESCFAKANRERGASDGKVSVALRESSSASCQAPGPMSVKSRRASTRASSGMFESRERRRIFAGPSAAMERGRRRPSRHGGPPPRGRPHRGRRAPKNAAMATGRGAP
mmetsp:Transcript_103158/g.300850  ORF Transcript_103158/g.300850 Transcript_103158/m.300850 type:complete len:229 (+) Transcript_103158:586-1272(+)